jgi:chromosome segregation ATPase
MIQKTCAEDNEKERLSRLVEELEGKVLRLSAENDTLVRERDLDELSLSFNATSLLTERVKTAERDLAKVTLELKASERERQSLAEHLIESRKAKDKCCTLLKENVDSVEVLKGEVLFYREQLTQAISERDDANFDLDSLRKDVSIFKETNDDLRRSLDDAMVDRDVLEQRLKEDEVRIQRLQRAANIAELVPSLKSTISELECKVERLDASLAEVTMERNLLREKAEPMELRLVELEESIVKATEHKVAALVDKSTAEATIVTLQTKIRELNKEVAALRQALMMATQEKVTALLGKAEAEELVRSGTTSGASSLHASPAKRQ